MPGLLLAQGDALHLPLRDKSVDCCVTSPPYFNLRRYVGVELTQWPSGTYVPVPGAEPIIVPAWHGCLGNEEAPSSYIWHLLLVLREVRRTLKDTGVCWVIIADAFSSGDRQGHGTRVGYKQQTNRGMNGTADPPRPPQPPGYAQGSLLGIPQQVMLAAMADNWVVRNDVVWAKAACMPESVRGWAWQQARCGCALPHHDTPVEQRPAVGGNSRNGSHVGTRTWRNAPDPACPHCGGTGRLATEVLRKGSWRHTRATETILMLTKGMGYWANGEAVREEATMKPQRRTNGHSLCTYDPPGRQAPSRGDRGVKDQPGIDGPGGRNPRNVVTPPASAHGLDHYAAFPPGLLLPLIRATCPERCCPTCGTGWAPCISDTGLPEPSHKGSRFDHGKTGVNGQGRVQLGERTRKIAHGLRPACPHYCTCGPLAPEPGLLVPDRTCPRCAKLLLSVWVPGVVLDPFLGSGTTLLVGRALGRTSVGLEASPHYVQLSRERLGLTALARWEGTPTAPPVEQHYGDLPLFALKDEPCSR
jgi:hypothetical protein